jgi:long-chain acyl-CoA synthetase
VYPSYPPDLVAYVVNDSEARTLIVEDAAQLAKALEARDRMPNLEQIVVIGGYEAPEPPKMVMTWQALRRLGRDSESAHKSTLAERVASTKAEDIATIVYTSGTTGPPKGVVQTHGNHIASLRASAEMTPVQPGWVHLLFLPLAHSFARLESFLGIYNGLLTAFAENLDKVGDNLKETRPHFICSVPRVFEKVYAKILAGVEAGPPAKRKIFHWAIGVGKDVSRHQQRGQPLPPTLALKRAIAHKLVFSKLHAALGGRLQWAVSGGAPLARDIAEFFHAAGILLLEGYGLTETCPVLTFNSPNAYKFGSVGRALPGVEVRIADDGEILARGANIATRGYYKQAQATAEVFEPSGWFHTGDIGRLDEDGFLFITDRKKDMIVNDKGDNVAPQKIEGMLTLQPEIAQAMVVGDKRPHLVGLIVPDAEWALEWARANDEKFALEELQDLPAFRSAVREAVDRVNADLSVVEKVRRIAFADEPFAIDNGEMTPSMKIRRHVIKERYGKRLDALYN